MTAQIIEKAGKKEFAVIPYKEFVRMQKALEDYHALKELRAAKVDPKKSKGTPVRRSSWGTWTGEGKGCAALTRFKFAV